MANDAFFTALLNEIESMQTEVNGRCERLKAAIEQAQRQPKAEKPSPEEMLVNYGLRPYAH